jgi:hypothetical protein
MKRLSGLCEIESGDGFRRGRFIHFLHDAGGVLTLHPVCSYIICMIMVLSCLLLKRDDSCLFEPFPKWLFCISVKYFRGIRNCCFLAVLETGYGKLEPNGE